MDVDLRVLVSGLGQINSFGLVEMRHSSDATTISTDSDPAGLLRVTSGT